MAADAAQGMGSIDGIGTSAGEYTVDPTDSFRKQQQLV